MYEAALLRDLNIVYPTPEHESDFLKSFALEPILKPYTSPRWIAGMGKSDGREAGYGTARYDKTFEARFAMYSADQQALMAALTQDIAMRLEGSGMRILERTGSGDEGFHFRYGSGRTLGTVTVTPVQQLDENHLGGIHGTGPKKKNLHGLRPGEIPVEFTIAAKETWTK